MRQDISVLSAEWINDRIANVVDKAEAIIDHLVVEGLLKSGYPPGTKPLTDDLLKRMTPTQVQMLIDSQPTMEGKAQIINRLVALRLPFPWQLERQPVYRPPSLPRGAKQTGGVMGSAVG